MKIAEDTEKNLSYHCYYYLFLILKNSDADNHCHFGPPICTVSVCVCVILSVILPYMIILYYPQPMHWP